MRTAGNRMLRRLCGKSLCERHSIDKLKGNYRVGIHHKLHGRNRLRLYGHVAGKEESDCVRRTWNGWNVKGRRP